MARYAFRGYCYDGEDQLTMGLQGMVGQTVGEGIVVAAGQTSPGEVSLVLDTTQVIAIALVEDACPQWGPWPDPFYLSPQAAGGFAVLFMTLIGTAWAIRNVRRAR